MEQSKDVYGEILIKVAIAANDDTGVDIFVPCTIEPGDTIKTFMWKDTQAPLSRVSEITIE